VASQATPGQFRCAGKEHQINRRIAACGGTQGTEEHQWTQGWRRARQVAMLPLAGGLRPIEPFSPLATPVPLRGERAA